MATLRPGALGRVAARLPLRRPGALTLVALCFAGSAVARAVDPSGALMAPAAMASPAPPEPTAGARECADAGALLLAIREREAQLEARADELADRARVLEAAQARFAEQEARLVDAEARLSATLARAEVAAEDDVGRLVAVFESMKPDRAAAVFETMEPGFAAGFLARMNRDAAARLLSGLTPERAYAISAVIAGRNAGAPRE